MASPNTTYEILKAAYTANGLSVIQPNTEFEVLNAVYSESDQALRVNVTNLESGLPYEKVEVTTPHLTTIKAKYIGVPGGCATEISLEAVTGGEDGNLIHLGGDGVQTINTLISAWNDSHPTNQVILLSGDGTQVIAYKSIPTLTGGGSEGSVNSISVSHSLNSIFIRVTLIGPDFTWSMFNYSSDKITGLDDTYYCYNVTTSGFNILKKTGFFTPETTYTILIEKLN